MKIEVHVHGTAFLCKGVHLLQVENALRPWLEYVDAESIAKATSMEREEVGIHFDAKEQTLDMCWTGSVGRHFHERLAEAFQTLCPLTEYASEITVNFYHDNGKEEFQQIFIGPSPEAIQEMRRQCVEEDLIGLLTPHLDNARVAQVTSLVNQLFEDEWGDHAITSKDTTLATPGLLPRNRHLH